MPFAALAVCIGLRGVAALATVRAKRSERARVLAEDLYLTMGSLDPESGTLKYKPSTDGGRVMKKSWDAIAKTESDFEKEFEPLWTFLDKETWLADEQGMAEARDVAKKWPAAVDRLAASQLSLHERYRAELADVLDVSVGTLKERANTARTKKFFADYHGMLRNDGTAMMNAMAKAFDYAIANASSIEATNGELSWKSSEVQRRAVSLLRKMGDIASEFDKKGTALLVHRDRVNQQLMQDAQKKLNASPLGD